MRIFKSLFGKRLDQALKRAGKNQVWLAEKLDVKPSAVSRWKTGRDFPEDDRLPAICSALGVDASFFTQNSSVGPTPPIAESEFNKLADKIIVRFEERASKDKELAQLQREIEHLREENRQLKKDLTISTSRRPPRELTAAWLNAEPEQHTIALLALTLDAKYVSRLAPKNQEWAKTFLKAAGSGPPVRKRAR